MRTPPAWLLALLLLAVPAAATIPRSATFELGEVEYLYVAGVNGTETVQLGDGTPLPMQACAFVMLNPGTPNGRVFVHGLYGNVPVDATVERFLRPDGSRGYTLDGTAELDGAPVAADLAVAGNASLRVFDARYEDPATATGDPEADEELPSLRGSAVLLPRGVRDDATGAPTPPQARDHELHVRITSPANASATPVRWTAASSGDLPDGSSRPMESYGAYHAFSNVKFGGEATLDIEFAANDLQDGNELRFVVLSPSGRPLGNATLAPAFLQPQRATLTFPLHEFGAYTVAVAGRIALGQYTLDATLAPPPGGLALDLWWENVTFGGQAYDDYRACTKAMADPDEAVAVDDVVGRPQPPRFPLGLVAIGVVGAATLVVIAVKLASDQLAGAAFRKAK